MSTPSAHHYSIAEVAEELGLTLRALRFYESRGLISPERKLRSRLYSEEDLERLRLIVKLKRLGLSILEIKQLITKPGNGPYGLSAALHADLVQRGEAQKSEAEAALAELRLIAALFCPPNNPADHSVLEPAL
jgi:DNA-binding transcriptional MerR regulator